MSLHRCLEEGFLKEEDFPVLVDFFETEIAKKNGCDVVLFKTVEDYRNNKKSFLILQLNYSWE